MPGFSIVTNISSLLAQDNLTKTNDLQQRTIRRLTSGLRINTSADDAAGLAIANRFRSDIAVLQQGVRNGADGLSTLQTIDGGLNNISLLIDRARTLATQSASGTFTGDRGALNSEFQSVLEEIDRQAQAIGLDPGGRFNDALSVFIGGGRTNNSVSEVTNGSVAIDLSNSAVNSNRLGLKGVQALGGVEGTTDIGAGSANTSVTSIVNDTTNQASLRNNGYSDFFFSGPGFSGDQKVRLQVNLAGVVDTTTLSTAINAAIDGFTSANSAGQAFQSSGIRASINTDSTGKQQLAFSSSSTAFQVQAGDLVSNAFLGNFNNSGVNGQGASLTVRVRGGTAAGDASVTSTVQVKIAGGGLTTAQTISLSIASTSTQAEIFNALESAVNGNTTLAAAGLSVSANATTDIVDFFNNRAEKFSVLVSGDVENLLGFGEAITDGSGNATFNTITGGSAIDVSSDGNARLRILIEGSGAATPETIDVRIRGNGDPDVADPTRQNVIDQINASIASNSTLTAAGFRARLSGANELILESTTGTEFQLLADDSPGGILGLTDTNGVVAGAAVNGGSSSVTVAGQNVATVAVGVDLDGGGIDVTITATLNSGYRGGAVTAAAANQTGVITFNVYNQRTETNSFVSVNVGNSHDSDAIETSIQSALNTALGAGVVTVGNGAGGATAALEFTAGGSANVNDRFTFSNVTFTHTAGTATFDIGILSSATFEVEPLNSTRIANRLNALAGANTSLSDAGIFFNVNGTAVDVSSFEDLTFTGTDAGNVTGFASGLAQTATVVNGTESITTGTLSEIGTFLESTINAGGARATRGAFADPSQFTGLYFGNDVQNLVITARDDSGTVHSLNINLNNSNGLTLDQTIDTINDALQQSNNSTLKQIVAVKERANSTEDGIRFLSTLNNGFDVGVGGVASAHGINDGGAAVLNAIQLAGGSIADISSQANAETAVNLLAEAVNRLGVIQSDVGRGQNRLQFAIGLASTQITNISAAESRIRDADLAAEAANLTRSSIAQQAGVAALAQANSAPEAVLALLRG